MTHLNGSETTNGHETTPGILHQPVLVLNQNYEPLNVCTLKRAVVLVFNRKAEILEAGERPVRSASHFFEAPSVIRLHRMIKRPRPRVKLTRREIFTRDHNTCQYCGVSGGDLTVDHVLPRSKGGLHTWDNVVTACRTCNHRKGGKTVQEARLRLIREPSEPSAGRYYAIERRIRQPYARGWLPFLPELEVSVSQVMPNGSSD